VSPKTVRRIVARGDLPVVRIGRLVRVRHDDLLAFIEKNTSAAVESARWGRSVVLTGGERLWD